MKTIREFSNHADAALAASFLRDHEIEVFLADEHSSAYAGPTFLVPIRLQVPINQAEQAEQLLLEIQEQKRNEDDNN